MRRLAVAGCGYWGNNLVRTLVRSQAGEVIVVDRNAAALRRIETNYPGLRTARELEEVLESVDAVLIATPPHTHAELIAKSIDAGCHVLVEKPFTTSSADGERLIGAARRAGVVLMVGHTYDYHPAVIEMERIVRRGDLGELRYLDSARLSVGGYRDDVNVMWDMAPHDLVIMRRLIGSWPTEVSAWSSDHSGLGMADIASMRLQFASERVVGYIRTSWLDPVKVRRFTAVGDRRMTVFNDIADPLAPLRIIDSSADARLGAGARHPLPPGYEPHLISAPPIDATEPLANEVAHFLECIDSGATPRSDGAEGLAAVRVLEAADESARTGRPVTVRQDRSYAS